MALPWNRRYIELEDYQPEWNSLWQVFATTDMPSDRKALVWLKHRESRVTMCVAVLPELFRSDQPGVWGQWYDVVDLPMLVVGQEWRVRYVNQRRHEDDEVETVVVWMARENELIVSELESAYRRRT